MMVKNKIFKGAQLALVLAAVSPVHAQLPSAADPSRIDPTPKVPSVPTYIPGGKPEILFSSEVEKPANAREVKFVLREIRLEGVTAFKQQELVELYESYINEKVSLDTIWAVAQAITDLYHKEQYFLSRAYVPAQEIHDGKVVIRVAEGYINEIECDRPSESYRKSKIIPHLNKELSAFRPIKASQLESYLLRVNDIPGIAVVGVLQTSTITKEGATKLVLKSSDKKGKGAFTIDNHSSKYFSVYGGTFSYQDSFINSQQTYFAASTSLGGNELKHGSIRHQVAFYPRWKLDLSAGYVNSNPGGSLSADDIVSNSWDASIGLEYQAIRQWHENLAITAKLDGKNTNTDIIKDTTLTRDRIRALRLGATYTVSDGKTSSNYWDIMLSKGMRIFGSSRAGDQNLSRDEAKPDFTKINFTYIRQQYLDQHLMLTGQVGGQLSSAELYSSEEYGYGGPSFGRAYDSSEITGDHGASASLELSYMGLHLQDLSATPYVFGDIGRVWNKDSDGLHAKAASVGFGLKLSHSDAFSSNFGIAWPLMRDIGEPIYGNGRSPRFLFQMKYGF